MRFNSYDERHVIPNADLFTHSLIVNTARELRHRDTPSPSGAWRILEQIKPPIVDTDRKVPGVLSDLPLRRSS